MIYVGDGETERPEEVAEPTFYRCENSTCRLPFTGLEKLEACLGEVSNGREGTETAGRFR